MRIDPRCRTPATLLVVLALGACRDAPPTSPEPEPLPPGTTLTAAAQQDVEALIGGSLAGWWRANHGFGPSMALSTAADALSSSWQNFGMLVPADGHVLGADGADTPRAIAFARFMQGLALGSLAQLFDEAWNLNKFLGSHPIWSRLDYRMIGPADASGAWVEWSAEPPQARQPFLIDTDDTRITGGSPTSDGAYVAFHERIFFRPDRGTYHFSFYADRRWAHLFETKAVGLHPDFPVKELDFIEAEAIARFDQGRNVDPGNVGGGG